MKHGVGEIVTRSCITCIEQEKHAGLSHRQIYIDKWENGEYSEHYAELVEAIDSPKTLTYEYQAPNNFCNLRCHMCGPILSSSIAKENIAIDKKGEFREKHGDAYHIKTADLSDYDEMLKGIFELKLVGGETLAIKENYDMMRRAVNLDVAKNINLVITTNGTLTPKFDGVSIFDFIPHFKSCRMIFSIEAWGDRNGYIRYPSKWDVIQKNAVKFINMPRTTLMFAACVSSLNVGHLDEVSRGSRRMMNKYPGRVVEFASGSLVSGGSTFYEVFAVPFDIREQYLDKYYYITDASDITTFTRICSYLENMEYDEEMMWNMLDDVKKKDIHRGTCLTDLFPEWKPYYDKL